MKVIIVGSIEHAITDLLPHIISFSKKTLRGEMKDGPFMIVRYDHPQRMYGLKLSGYEVHPSCRPSPMATHCINLAKARAAQKGGE